MTPADRPDLSDETFHLDLKPGPDPLARQGVRRTPIYRLKRLLKVAARECGFKVRWGRENSPCELSEHDTGGPMIRLLDGPAAGQNLMLRRAPLYLRVVFNTLKQKWDALDQLADTPSPGEVVFVYKRLGEPSVAYLDWTEGGKRRGGRFAFASYELVEPQPEVVRVRDTKKWQAWCWEQVKKPTPEVKPCGPDSSAVASASTASPSTPSAPSAASEPSAKSTSGSAGASPCSS